MAYANPDNESVYFYTFHKCASTLFSSYVLKNIRNLQHINYATEIYNGRKVDNITFQEKGYIYGPIRLSANPASPVYEKLVAPTSDNDFIANKIAIFLIRDPRDILVSAYYSFGFTHGFSPVDELRQRQEQRRQEILSMTIDEYAIDSAPQILNNFSAVDRLNKACSRSIVLRYEDMINNWNSFSKNLTKYAQIKPNILEDIYKQSRPKQVEDKTKHQRSGKPGGAKNKLKSETLAILNVIFESILEKFKYNTY